jgi:hypothetical protein
LTAIQNVVASQTFDKLAAASASDYVSTFSSEKKVCVRSAESRNHIFSPPKIFTYCNVELEQFSEMGLRPKAGPGLQIQRGFIFLDFRL